MYSAIDLIRDVWVYVRPRKGRFFVASLLRVASDIAWLYPPYALAIVVEYLSHYTVGMSMTPVYTPIALSFVAIVIRYAGLYLGKNTMFVLSERAALDAQMRAMRHIMMLDTSWHEAENSGNKFKRIDRGADSVDRIIRIWINNIIEIVINLVGVTIILLRFDTKIGVSILVFLAFFYVIAKFFRKRAVAITNIVNAKEENRDGILFEIINNIRSVKVMSMSRKLIDIMASNAEELLSLIRARIFWFQSGFSVRNFCAQVFRLCGITFIIYGISLGYYEIGFLILFVGYFDRAWQSVAELTDISEDLAVAKAAVMRMQSIINTKIVIDDDTGKASFPENWNRISVKGLSFSYKDKAVLDNVTFEINRGEKVGVVGLSGAGKSTLFKLLLKEHETYSGDITIDDKSLRNIKKQDYLKHLAVVLQDTELFNASLRDNVTITNYDRQDDNALFEKSIDIAHVRDFMDKLPNGADSVIGEKGIKLSGGEKQRVGIARAVFKDPEILLLDEATSHLDIESEKTIQDSLHRFFENVTAIVIAHRLTTIKEMDKIIVMQDGKIIETGTFDELIASRGRFAELWERQGL